MKKITSVVALLCFFFTLHVSAQQSQHGLTIELSVDKELAETIEQKGRLFVFLSENSRGEPRTKTWPSPQNKTFIFARNIDDFSPEKRLNLTGDQDWIGTPSWNLDQVPEGEYWVQVLWDQNTEASNINAPGNVYSKKQKVKVNESKELALSLSESIGERKVDAHELVRVIDFKSDTLSGWWNKEMRLKASILLPHGYDENKAYPIRYNVAGYGGRYDRINYLLRNKQVMNWWDSENGPEIINVFLDGEGPFGDSYQMDSKNSGPYGYALTEELIPYIEKKFRGTQSAKHRFVDGCSTGGWVSLGLQLYYPDVFDGVFSYSPDAIAFENYQLVNIYKDKNAFVNEFGYERPVMRSSAGEPMLSLREFIQYENVLGASNSYLNSGGQFSAHTALYSPQGEDGLPKPLFHPQTGEIDLEVAEYWKAYDLKLYAKKNWKELGPKLQGKIYIWMGDMDNFYLNTGTREFDEFIKNTKNPSSDAVIEYTAMAGHCDNFSHGIILKQIQEKMRAERDE